MIRAATLTDLDALTELFAAYLVFYQVESQPEKARAFLRQRLENGDSRLYLCEENGQAVGFMQLYPLFDSLALKPLWMLNDLFVRPECRNHGCGAKLIAEAKRLAQDTGAAGVILDTAKTNAPGNALYPKTGFHRIEDFNFYRLDV
ncbi:GNAT family N-acetyltransferase [Eikenella sp. S3360]|uniref:GNAT family N-acetyltransferase n=1 Tax=Eikenella glucosivorans TaxID=2766967 RepID=A0ABS0NAG2_9NEIS|nr:GNAT family N-acetyltransferase [Eikenella glucosivorans]MBH5329266.1 GNAT family N-acetyltransferase [Eikenella glucosivorans]